MHGGDEAKENDEGRDEWVESQVVEHVGFLAALRE